VMENCMSTVEATLDGTTVTNAGVDAPEANTTVFAESVAEAGFASEIEMVRPAEATTDAGENVTVPDWPGKREPGPVTETVC
jgi:hypothetical protein